MTKFSLIFTIGINGARIVEESFVSSMPLHWTNCICPFVKYWLDESNATDFNWDSYELPEVNEHGSICALNFEKNQLSPDDLNEFYESNESKIHSICGNPLPEADGDGWNRGVFDSLTVSESFSVGYNALNGYGCYCSAGSNWAYGVGTPVDDVDARCKKVHSAYKCLRKYDSPTCDIENQVYIAMQQNNANDDQIRQTCQGIQGMISERLRNVNFDLDCAIRKCAIEVSFSNYLVQRATTPGVTLAATFVRYDQRYKNRDGNFVMGTFEYQQECLSTPGTNDFEDCCGLYPFRKPFYNELLECCDNVRIAAAGTC